VHGRIFERILQLLDRKAVVTPVTLRPISKATRRCGAGRDGLSGAPDGRWPGLIAPRVLAEQIYDLAMLRELVRVGRDLVQGAMDTSEEVEPLEQIEAAEAALYQVADGAGSANEARALARRPASPFPASKRRSIRAAMSRARPRA
jgi:replicative DNA helicase